MCCDEVKLKNSCNVGAIIRNGSRNFCSNEDNVAERRILKASEPVTARALAT